MTGAAARGAERRRTVLATLGLGGLALLVGSAVWVRASTSSAVQVDVPLAVVGTVMAPAVNAGGLVLLASACALALGGRWGRVLAAGGIVLGGLLVALSAVAALGAAEAAAVSAARAAVGVGTLDRAAAITPLPWFAVALGAAAVVLGVRTVLTSRHWSAPTSRHEPVSVGATTQTVVEPAGRGSDIDEVVPLHDAPDTGETWDALTRGEDPT